MNKSYTVALVALLCVGLILWTEIVAAAQAIPGDNTVLNILDRWWVNNSDYMTSTNPAEQPPGSTFNGQMYYVPSAHGSGVHAVFRLVSPSGTDHMDSLSSNEGGYTNEGILGYPYDTQVTGTCALDRWVSGITGDHATAFCGENLSGSGYSLAGSLGYGYPRYGNTGVQLVSVAGSQVTVKANLVTGGAVWELWWNGKEFINDHDFGRQLSWSIFLTPQPETDYNPGEVGDIYGGNAVAVPPFGLPVPAGWAHGSPLIAYSVVGTTLQTTTQPLDYDPRPFGGGPNNPVLWKGTFAKEVDLDFSGDPNIIRWTTQVTLPSAQSYVDLQILNAALNSEFNRFYAYNATTDTLTNMTSLVPVGNCLDPSQDARLNPSAGAGIAATQNGAYALGIYRSNQNVANDGFALCNFLNLGGSGQNGNATSGPVLLYRPAAGLGAGSYSWTVYVLVGSLNTVRSKARWLYRNGF